VLNSSVMHRVFGLAPKAGLGLSLGPGARINGSCALASLAKSFEAGMSSGIGPAKGAIAPPLMSWKHHAIQSNSRITSLVVRNQFSTTALVCAEEHHVCHDQVRSRRGSL